MTLREELLDHLEPFLRFYASDETWQGRWLAPAEAYEIQLILDPQTDPASKQSNEAQLLEDIRDLFQDLPLDINLLPDDDSARRRKLLIADMDSTIIQNECIDEIAAHMGLGDRVSAITEAAMRGELDFEAALKERVSLLKGLGEAALQEVFDERIKLMPGARTLIQTMRANGAFCALISGGFTFFTSRIAQQVGFDVHQANTLDVENGKLSGTVATPILGRQAKLEALLRYREDLSLARTDTLAIGDGANDLAMIEAAGLGVAYRAKPVVAEKAQAAITHGDLTAILYLQGFTRNEFVE
ncbi:MAG TPA: phosphoserine phosphatase SerB [Rhizobiales bacterium]|nr:phosphoserine phosphatase SerB [Hyphomicrobiales bacterium]